MNQEFCKQLITLGQSNAYLNVRPDTMPDAPKTAGQIELASKHGTPREFSTAVIDAIGEITYQEAMDAIGSYLKQWDEA